LAGIESLPAAEFSDNIARPSAVSRGTAVFILPFLFFAESEIQRSATDMTDCLMNNITRLAVNFDHGRGVWVWDDKGRQYLDALCGVAVTGLGHDHPAVSQAICQQAQKLLHC